MVVSEHAGEQTKASRQLGFFFFYSKGDPSPSAGQEERVQQQKASGKHLYLSWVEITNVQATSCHQHFNGQREEEGTNGLCIPYMPLWSVFSSALMWGTCWQIWLWGLQQTVWSSYRSSFKQCVAGFKMCFLRVGAAFVTSMSIFQWTWTQMASNIRTAFIQSCGIYLGELEITVAGWLTSANSPTGHFGLTFWTVLNVRPYYLILYLATVVKPLELPNRWSLNASLAGNGLMLAAAPSSEARFWGKGEAWLL